MNPNIEKALDDAVVRLERNLADWQTRKINLLVCKQVIQQLTFSDPVQINAFGGSIWFDVYNREDLKTAMTLAPSWKKEYEGATIVYEATLHDLPIQLFAKDAALPDTCKLVEEQYIEPAREAQVRTRMVVKCDV